MSTPQFTTVTMADLITSDLRTDASTPVSEVAEVWQKNPQVDGMAVLGDGHVRYLSRARFFVQLGKRFGYSLFEHRPVALLAEEGATVEADMDPVEVVALATQREPEKVYDDLLVVEAGAFRGLVSMRSLLVHHKSLLAAGIAERALLEQQNRQLQQLNVERREFIAELAQQVRGPLDTIIGLAWRLLADAQPGDSKTLTLNALMARGYDALSVVNELQELAMIERQELTPQSEAIELAPVFAEAEREARIMIAGRSIQLDINSSRAPERFETDPLFLSRILSHLLAGVIRRTTEGRLSLVALGTSEGLVLNVRNKGEQVGTERLTWIAPKGTPAETGAPGERPKLGFVALKGLVDLIGGRIDAYSNALGGSGLIVTLPPGPYAVHAAS